MPTYTITGPDGRDYSIDGPPGATQEQVVFAIQQQLAAQTQQQGYVGAFKEGATSLGALPAAAKFGVTDTPDARLDLIAAQQSDRAKTRWEDVKDVPSFVDWAKQTAGTSMGYLAAPGAAGLAAQLMKGPAVGKAVGLGVLGAQYLTDNLGRQAAEQQISEEQGLPVKPASIGRAALAAAGQTGLDVVGFKFFEPAFKALPFVGKLFGKEGGAAAKEAADQLADAVTNRTLKFGEGIVTGIGKGVVFEVPQEVAQQALERWQAGISLSDEEARREYGEAMAGAMLLGGGLGAVSGAVDTHEARVAERAKEAGHLANIRQQQREARAARPSITEEEAVAAIDLPTFERAKEAQKESLAKTLGITTPIVPTVTPNLDPALVSKANSALAAISKDGVVPAEGGVRAVRNALGLGSDIKSSNLARKYYDHLSTKGADGVRRLNRAPDTGGIAGKIEDELPAGFDATKETASAATQPPVTNPVADAGTAGTRPVVPAPEDVAAAAPSEVTKPDRLDNIISDTGRPAEGAGGVQPALKPTPAGNFIAPEADLTDEQRAALEAAPNVAEKWAAEKPLDEPTTAFLQNLDVVRKRIPDQPETLAARSRLDTLKRDLRQGKPLDEKAVRDLQKYAERFPQTEAPPPAPPGPVELKQGKPVEDIVALVEADERTAKEEKVEVINHKTGKIETKVRPVRNKIQKILTRLSETGNGAYSALAKQMRDLEELPEDTGPANTPEKGTGNWNIDKPPRAKTTQNFLNPKIIIEGSKTDNPEVIARLKAEGKVAEYNASKNEFAFTREGLTDKVFLHEFVHAFTVKNLKQYARDSSKLTPEQRIGAKQIFDIYEQAKKSDLKAKYPDAFDSIYEFVSYAMTEPQMQADLRQMKTKPVYTAGLDPRKTDVSSLTARKTTFDLWSKFTQAVAKLLGLNRNAAKPGAQFHGNALLELTEAVSEIMAIPSKVTGVGKLAAAAQKAQRLIPASLNPDLTADEQIRVEKEMLDEQYNHSRGVKEAVKYYGTFEGYESLVRRFQNDRRPLKLLQDVLWMAGKLIVGGVNANNLYDALTLSTQRAHWAMTENLQAPMARMNTAVSDYAVARGIDSKQALAELDAFFVAEHERERRHQKFLKLVPLDQNVPFIIKELDNTPRSAAAHREFIYKLIDGEVTGDNAPKISPERLRAIMEVLTDKNSGYLSREGSSLGMTPNADQRAHESLLTEDSDFYAVLGSVSPGTLENVRAKHREVQQTHGAQLAEVRQALKEVQDATNELNRKANYWSEPVDRIVRFYGWKNYVPFKGRPKDYSEGSEDAKMETYGSRGAGGFEFVESQEAFMGRESAAENAILQTMVDAAKSALRVGRMDVAPALKNLIEQKHIRGSTKNFIPFGDRYKNQIDPKVAGGDNKVYLYLPDGQIQVLEINASDKQYAEAIRRSYRAPSPILNFVNQITSAMGHMHTRYNPAFHPYNFVRDALTNAFNMGATMGVDKAGQYLSTIAARVATGGMNKARKISWLYANGRIAEIEDLAKTDKYAQDILEYLRVGGRVAYIMGVSNKGQIQELSKEVGESNLSRRWGAFNKYVDVWADLFEFTSRAAAYSVFKEEYMRPVAQGGRGMDAEAASIKAAADAKNLANFEQIGTRGREAGALFMFFRPAATGAVAALDSVRSIFISDEKMLEQLPNDLANDPASRAKLIERHHELQRNARLMLGSLAGAGFMIYMMAALAGEGDEGDEEFGQNKILTDDTALWTRNMRLPLSLFGSDNKGYLQLPWGFGLGAVAATGAQVAAFMSGSQSGQKMIGNLINISLDSYIPIPVSRIDPLENPTAWVVDSLAPSIARPLIEFTMNTDGLGREIYNNRVTKYGDAALGGTNIPEAYHTAARLLRDITNGDVDIQPSSMYFWANNYLDGLTRVGHNAYGLGLAVSGQKDFDPKTDTFLFNSFIGRKSNIYAREFAAVQEKIEQKEKTLKMFENNPAQYARYQERDPYAAQLVYTFNQVEGTLLKGIRTELNRVRADPTLTPKERKDMVDALNLQQNRIKYWAVEYFKAYGVSAR